MRKSNVLELVLISAGFAFAVLGALSPVFAASGNSTAVTASAAGEKYLAAGVAFGLAAFGAGLGVGQSGAAAIAAVTEKREVFTNALLFVALAEAIAIYGFAIAILILGQPS
ncbi:MAG TPA: ATP synthase subunit C [Nitrososphaerales archaeon]|nr:ATP synthase subunit C [Nitrososphaerales archaeon]